MANRTETVDNNETITIHARMGLENPVAAKLLLPAITDGTSNTIMFGEVVRNPGKLQSGFGGRMTGASESSRKLLRGLLGKYIQKTLRRKTE